MKVSCSVWTFGQVPRSGRGVRGEGVPFGRRGRIRRCAPRYAQRAPPPVSARAGARLALLPPPADPRRGRPRAVDFAQAAAARVCAVRGQLPRGPVRAADVGRRATADRAAFDPGRRRRTPGRLSPLLALRPRVPSPLRSHAGPVSRPCAAARRLHAGKGGRGYAWTCGLASAASDDGSPGTVSP